MQFKHQPIYYLYLHRFFNEFADSLIKVFVPVVIYARTSSLQWVIAFILGYYIMQSCLNLLMSKQLCKYPLQAVMLRLLPVIIMQVVLVSGLAAPFFVTALVITTALSNALYWVPVNYLFTSLADDKLGARSGQFRAVSRFGNLLAPLISGVLITRFGILSVVFLAIINYGLSLLVILPARGNIASEYTPVPTENETVIKQSPAISLKFFLMSYLVVGIFDTSEIFWALYIYTISATYIKVGIAATLVKAGVMLANLIIGKMTDRDKWFGPAIIATVLFSALWFMRMNSVDSYSLYILSVLSGFCCPFFLIPVFSRFVLNARNSKSVPQWLAYREIGIKSGGALAVVISLFLPVSLLKAPFLLSAGGALWFVRILCKLRKK